MSSRDESSPGKILEKELEKQSLGPGSDNSGLVPAASLTDPGISKSGETTSAGSPSTELGLNLLLGSVREHSLYRAGLGSCSRALVVGVGHNRVGSWPKYLHVPQLRIHQDSTVLATLGR